MKPTGNVTFLFTDIEGSTKLSQEYPEYYPDALKLHDSILHKAVENNNGFVFKTVGDAFCCSFQYAAEALHAAVKAQILLSEEDWGEAPIKVRIGIHSGKAEWNGIDYMGYITLARVARIMSAANGEQIIISEISRELIKDNDIIDDKILFRDLGERRLKDVIQPVRLFQVMSPGLREDFPPLKTLDARANNLPAQLTSFIGREDEMKNIKELLKHSRLVTLLGTGGAGKTRLTIQIAADLIDEFANGVWFIELASVSDPEYLAQTIANLFSLQSQMSQDIEEALINYLSEKEILLIFDNCEHIIDSCSVLAEKLLMSSPGLKIITSSREVLRCRGEVTHRVSALTHPDPEKDITPLQLSQFEAARLFIERALTVNPDFRITDENVTSLAQICYRLDGIPLAIELASARTRILPVEMINERLEDRFRLLTGGNRTDIPRQQTLRSLIDWSYDLLSEKEKMLFCRLSVFSGGWTIEAAESVCPDENIEKYEVLDMMTGLFEKSLINSTGDSRSTRFDLLESLKVYGSEKLQNSYSIFYKHFEYYSRIASESEMRGRGFDELGWLKEAGKEKENIRSAINWSIENETEKAYKLVLDSSNLFQITGSVLEANQNCSKLLKKNKFTDECSRALFLKMNSGLLLELGKISEAFKMATESLAVFRKLNLKLYIAESLNILGSIARINDNSETGKIYYEEALAISRENGFKRELLTALYNLSFRSVISGDTEVMRKYKEDALKLSREIKDSNLTLTILAGLAILETESGNPGKGKIYTEESILLARQMNNQNFISINLSNLGDIYLRENDFDNAEYSYNESLRISKEFGLINIYPVYKNLGNLFKYKGEYEKALIYYKESLKYGIKFGTGFFTEFILKETGISYFIMGKHKLSLRVLLILKKLYTERVDQDSEKIHEYKRNFELINNYILQLRKLLGDEIYMQYTEESESINTGEIEKYVMENCFER